MYLFVSERTNFPSCGASKGLRPPGNLVTPLWVRASPRLRTALF